ncbi:ThiF family domain containing protein [Babesia divergens]|uniref:NEDD8-activating enzyme E1 catalytic subunit n=1 Tax=Babesia divergens TaxID=32595 RepID=A0AAD9GHP0_BABDI|nr:ThiF family domain containing protein [Babesia divergens]
MDETLEANILLIGAGGLGCEIIKNLLIKGAKNITIVDPDTIEIHNLTRQIIYRIEDCGQPKARVAAERINARDGRTHAKFIATAIQDVPIRTIAKFDLIISTVDNIDARRWINMAVMVIWQRHSRCGNSQTTEELRPWLVDGGSQELYGHVRVMSNRNQPCLECSLPLFTSENDTPSCSLPNKPKTPEDCIKYGIKSITMDMVDKTLNVTTTNSIVAALITNIITKRQTDNNFYFYSGRGHTVLDAFAMQKQQDCMMCNCNAIAIKTQMTHTLEQLVHKIATEIQSKHINVTSKKGTIYMGTSKMFEQLYSSRMDKTLGDLQDVIDDILYVTTKGEDAWYWVYLDFDEHGE